MTEFSWRLPGHGDARRAGTQANRAGFDDLLQIVDAAELAGLDGVVAPFDPEGFESWVVSGAALRATRHLAVNVEFEPTFGSPVYAAKVSTTLQRLSHGRLSWRLAAVDVSTDQHDLHAEKYRRAEEFLTVARAVWNEEPVGGDGFEGTGVDYDGEFFHVANGGFRGILSGVPFPTVHTSGHDFRALELSARLGDVHIFSERAHGIGDSVRALQDATGVTGRHVRVGIEIPVIARETDSEAWARVERLARQANGDLSSASDLGDTRWTGFRQLGFDLPIGLVGSYQTVAERLREYVTDGVSDIVLTGRPHIEEVHRLGEHVLHLVDPVGRVPHPSLLEEVSV